MTPKPQIPVPGSMPRIRMLLLIDIFNEGIAEVADGDDEFVFDGGGGDSASETEFFGFGDALIGAEGGADFPAEPDFAEDDVFFRKFATGDSAGNGETNGEISGRILELEAANDIDKDVLVGEFEFCAALKDGDEEVQAVQVAAGGGAFRIAEV